MHTRTVALPGPIGSAALDEARAAAPEVSELFMVSLEGMVVASSFEPHVGRPDTCPRALAAGLAAPFLHGPYVGASQAVATASREQSLNAASAAAALDHITGTVADSRAMIRGIAEASSEQRSATGRIASSIEGIARRAEANALAVTHAESSARNLQYLAGDLRKSVCRFNLGKT